MSSASPFRLAAGLLGRLGALPARWGRCGAPGGRLPLGGGARGGVCGGKVSVREAAVPVVSSASPSAPQPGVGRPRRGSLVGRERRGVRGRAPLPRRSRRFLGSRAKLCAEGRVGVVGPPGRAAKPPPLQLRGCVSVAVGGAGGAGVGGRRWGWARSPLSPSALLGQNGIGTAASLRRVRAARLCGLIVKV